MINTVHHLETYVDPYGRLGMCCNLCRTDLSHPDGPVYSRFKFLSTCLGKGVHNNLDAYREQDEFNIQNNYLDIILSRCYDKVKMKREKE